MFYDKSKVSPQGSVRSHTRLAIITAVASVWQC
jgi:hypothetical protein